jgi:hypothetical protein
MASSLAIRNPTLAELEPIAEDGRPVDVVRRR